MRMTIKKWGNSLAARIPKAIIEAVNGTIVITPIKGKKEYTLEELLSQCGPGSMTLTKEDKGWLNAEPVDQEDW